MIRMTKSAPVPWRSATSSMGSTAKVRSILASIHIRICTYMCIYVHIAIPNIDRKVHSNFILVGFNGILLFHLFDSNFGVLHWYFFISLPFARLLYPCVWYIVLSWLNGSGIYHHISQLLACAWLKYHCSTPFGYSKNQRNPIQFGHVLDPNSYPISKSTQKDKHVKTPQPGTWPC